MTTVAQRCFRSSPNRDAFSTWSAIIDLLTAKSPNARKHLEAVSGIASSVIADQACLNAPIVVTCDGPRTRIYCLYDDNAVDGSDANEEVLGYDALKGDWAVSIPCDADDLEWVTGALLRHGEKITARDKDQGVTVNAATSSSEQAFTIDAERMLQS